MRFDLETEIRFSDGERAGILQKVAVAKDGSVVSVIMATDHLLSRTVMVPPNALSEAPGNVLQINLSDDEIGKLPDYVEEMEPAISDGWDFDPEPIPGADVFPATLYEPNIPVVEVPNLPEGVISISQSTEVDCTDGRWGIVDEVLTGDDGKVSHIVGRSDDEEEYDQLIPVEAIREYSSETVTLNCTLAELPANSEELVDEAEEPEVE